jgi:hypothetical protein
VGTAAALASAAIAIPLPFAIIKVLKTPQAQLGFAHVPPLVAAAATVMAVLKADAGKLLLEVAEFAQVSSPFMVDIWEAPASPL